MKQQRAKTPRRTLQRQRRSKSCAGTVDYAAMWDTISNAMSVGQTMAVIASLAAERDYHLQERPHTRRTRPVRDTYTMQPLELDGEGVHIYVTRAWLDTVAWLAQQGLKHCYCGTLRTVDGIVTESVTVLDRTILLRAVWCPQPAGPSHTLLAEWNGVRTQKCLDDSMESAWANRIVAARACGATTCVLATLYEGTDFFAAKSSPGDAHCPAPRHYLTLEAGPRGYWVAARFSHMIQWTAHHQWKWTLLVDTINETPTWAYFTLLLDPLTLCAV